MANFSPTFSGDFSSFLVGKIFDIISDAKSERAKADKEAAKYGVDVDFTPGEFTARSARNSLIESTLGRRFVPQTRYPDLLARGQFSSDPLMGTPANVRKLPEYQQLANPQERLFNNSSYITGKNIPSSGTRGTTSTTGEKPVKVKDEKLGGYLAAVIKALNANIASINERLDDTEQGVIEAKEGVFGTIKQLEQNSDLLETKLDSIIDALRQQNLLAKTQEDQSEVQRREDETEVEKDLSGTERLIQPDEKKEDTIQLNLLEDIQDAAEKRDEQLSLPLIGGQEGFERGGIVSGPDSGYYTKLHGDEMIVPLDNNYTQGESSAIDGKVAPKPKTPVVPKYEMGTKSPITSDTPLPSMGPKIFEKSAAVDNKLPDLMEMGGELQKAMEFPVKAAGIITMNVMQEAVSNMGGLAGGVAQQLKQVSSPLAAAFGVSNTITNSLIRGKSVEKETGARKKKTQRYTTDKRRRAWWDPLGLFTGEGGGYRKGSGGGTRIERYSNDYGGGARGLARGTRARVGFTGMNSQGFNAMMQGQNYVPSSKPQILGQGAYSAPTLRGAERYAGTSGSLGGRQTPGGVVRSIVPANAPRINFLEPQAKTTPEMFNKGRDLATKLMDPNYRPNSATANRLRTQMRTGGVRPPVPRGGVSAKALMNPVQLFLELVWNELTNPQAAGAYDQVTGPNAMYNNPKLSEERRRSLFESVHGPGTFGQKAAIVNMESQGQALSKFNKQRTSPDPIVINNQTVEDTSVDLQQSHISNMGDPGFSSLYPSPY